MTTSRTHASQTPNVANDVWKYVATVCAGCLITTATFWIGGAAEFVRRRDIPELLQSHSPYLQDRKVLFERLDSLKENLGEVKGQVGEILRELRKRPEQ